MPTEQNQGINPNSSTNGTGNPVSNDLNQNVGGDSVIDLNLDGISIPEQNQNNVDPLNTAVEQPANFDVTGVQWGQSQLGGDSVDEIQKSETIVEDINTNPVGDDWLLREDQAVENSEQNIVETGETALSSDPVGISENSEGNVQPEVQSQPTVDNFSGYQYQQPDSQVNDTEEDLSAMVDGLNKGPEKDNSLLMDWDDDNGGGTENNEGGMMNNEGGDEKSNTEEDLSAMVDGLNKGPEKDNSLLMDWNDDNEGGTMNNEGGTEDNEGGTMNNEGGTMNNEGGTMNNEGGQSMENSNNDSQTVTSVLETQNISTGVSENVTEVEIPKENLVVENIGTPVVENNNGELVSDTGDFTGKTTGYIPNESEFQQMSQLLDNSKPGEVDLSSMPQNQEQANSEVSIDEQVQSTEKGVFNIDSIVSSLQQSSQVQQAPVETPVTQVTTPVTENVTPDNGQTTNAASEVVLSVDQNPVEQAPIVQNPVEQPVVAQPVESQSVLNQNQNPVGLDGVTPNVVANIPANNVQMPEMQQPVQQSFMPNGNVFVPQNVQMQNIQPGNIQSSGDIQQLLTQNEKTKGSHTGLYVILIVVILIVGGCFVLSKMYPDVVSAILGKNNVVIDYSENSNVTASLSQDENANALDNDMEGENVEILGEELQAEELGGETLDNLQEGEDIVDPDSLAALIENNLENSDENMGENGNNVEENELDHSSAEDEFNPYNDLGNLIDEEKGDMDNILNKLNEYKSRAEIYQTWGTENNEQTVYKYGTYIVKKCTTMIENIESGSEIDTNLIDQEFSKFDSYFVKMDEIKK